MTRNEKIGVGTGAAAMLGLAWWLHHKKKKAEEAAAAAQKEKEGGGGGGGGLGFPSLPGGLPGLPAGYGTPGDFSIPGGAPGYVSPPLAPLPSYGPSPTATPGIAPTPGTTSPGIVSPGLSASPGGSTLSPGIARTPLSAQAFAPGTLMAAPAPVQALLAANRPIIRGARPPLARAVPRVTAGDRFSGRGASEMNNDPRSSR